MNTALLVSFGLLPMEARWREKFPMNLATRVGSHLACRSPSDSSPPAGGSVRADTTTARAAMDRAEPLRPRASGQLARSSSWALASGSSLAAFLRNDTITLTPSFEAWAEARDSMAATLAALSGRDDRWGCRLFRNFSTRGSCHFPGPFAPGWFAITGRRVGSTRPCWMRACTLRGAFATPPSASPPSARDERTRRTQGLFSAASCRQAITVLRLSSSFAFQEAFATSRTTLFAAPLSVSMAWRFLDRFFSSFGKLLVPEDQSTGGWEPGLLDAGRMEATMLVATGEVELTGGSSSRKLLTAWWVMSWTGCGTLLSTRPAGLVDKSDRTRSTEGCAAHDCFRHWEICTAPPGPVLLRPRDRSWAIFPVTGFPSESMAKCLAKLFKNLSSRAGPHSVLLSMALSCFSTLFLGLPLPLEEASWLGSVLGSAAAAGTVAAVAAPGAAWHRRIRATGRFWAYSSSRSDSFARVTMSPSQSSYLRTNVGGAAGRPNRRPASSLRIWKLTGLEGSEGTQRRVAPRNENSKRVAEAMLVREESFA
mmetsp:Transcript_24214/g.67327  ORF Transcript_24214/g.67327 Transcript_24214/m.67327 type:complete len:538 (-) Transcript_24214:130-1743(-)